MDLDRFNYRGLGIGFFGVGLAMGGVALGVYLPNPPSWLVFGVALAGIGLGAVGHVVHVMDMRTKYRAEETERQAWIRLHGDPDRRDDPALRSGRQ